MGTKRCVMLAILDGWGWREEAKDNAVRLAKTPNFDAVWGASPHAFLVASGADVGLPDGQMGNSEVGHLNIGAGRVVLQDLPRIAQAMRDGSIEEAPAFQEVVTALERSGGACHLLGLVSDGGVHAHLDHMAFLARLLTQRGIEVHLHAFTDGRDTPPQSGLGYFEAMLPLLPEGARLATVCGRYFAMDRDRRWERVAKAYGVIARGEGAPFADGIAAIKDAYGRGVTDEFIEPCVIGDYRGVADGDAILSFNFRADRVREILSALLAPDFDGFSRGTPLPRFSAAAGMADYGEALAGLVHPILAPQRLDDVLGAVVAASGRTQLRMAETEKYPHVTYFLNGGEEAVYPGESRVMVPSPKVATYDLQPEMSSVELTDEAVKAIGSGDFDLIVINYANPDMVGHTGDLGAAIRAVEAVDTALGRVVAAIQAVGGVLLVTADHGNCEVMADPVTGGPHTAHTTNRVPIALLGQEGTLHDGRLADIAPTLLALLGVAQPAAMTGSSLLSR